MRRLLSIRARLMVGVVVLIAGGLAIANIAGIVLLRSYLQERVDAQVTALHGSPGPGPGPGPGARPGARPDLGRQPTPAELCQSSRNNARARSDFVIIVRDHQGATVCTIGASLGSSAPDLGSLPTRATAGPVTVHSKDSHTRWRVRVVAQPDGSSLVLAVSMSDADATVHRLMVISASTSAAVLALTVLLSWAVAAIGLRPLRDIEQVAARIADGDLSRRVPEQRRRTEVGRLARALNGMLGQIERSFTAKVRSEETLRRFVADASHELRTPIATIRGHTELWRNGVMQDAGGVRTVMSRVEAESLRMGALVDDMLLLARMDQERPLAHEPVDLLSLAVDAVVDAQARQPERHIDLDPGTAKDGLPVVAGDEHGLRQVLANLLSNALHHTPVGSPIQVGVDVHAGRVVLTVADRGPGMSPDVVAQVFHRFYRADAGRSRDQGGSGLGLAIVESLVEAHAGTVTCVSTVEAGTCFTVSLPAMSTEPAPPGPDEGVQRTPSDTGSR